MERRTVLGLGLGMGAVAASANPAAAQGAVSLTLKTDFADMGAALADRVSRTSGGEITINVEAMDAGAGLLADVSGGSADMYLTVEDAFIAENPAFGFFACTPGGMSPSEFEAWVIVSDGRYMWDLLGESYGIKSFMAGDLGPMPIWSKAAIGSMSDLLNAKVGSSGLALMALQEMGVANVTDISDPGADLGGLDVIDGLSVAKMADRDLLGQFSHMTSANALRPMCGLSLGVNAESWAGLSETQQAMVERCIMAEHGVQRALAMHQNASVLSGAGDAVTSHAIPEDIWAAQMSAASGVVSSMFDAGDVPADTADAYLYFIEDVARWSEIGEAAFFNGRNSALSL